MEQQGKGFNWTWVIVGGGAIVLVVVVLSQKSSSTSNGNNVSQSGQQVTGTSASVTSNTGTPSNNGSWLGFTDPSTGIQWVLDAAGQWISALPGGTLPPNYTPGASYLSNGTTGVLNPTLNAQQGVQQEIAALYATNPTLFSADPNNIPTWLAQLMAQNPSITTNAIA